MESFKPLNNVGLFQFSWRRHVLFPLFLLLVFTPWSSEIDQALSHFFYRDGHFISSAFIDFLYEYGVYPAWGVIGIALFILLNSLYFSPFKKLRRISIYLILTLAIGSGIIVHGIFKDHWGRPRPKQVIDYGGNQPFLPYYKPYFSNPTPSKSFPCGHCSTGFYFFAIALAGAQLRSRFLYRIGFIFAWGFGMGLGLLRIAQGGHFFSDVLLAGLIMWFSSLFLSFLFVDFKIIRLRFKIF